MNGGELKSF
jgi:hypothetical protein